MLLPYCTWKKLLESSNSHEVSYVSYEFPPYDSIDHVEILNEVFGKFTQVKVNNIEEVNDFRGSEKKYLIKLEISDDSDLGLLTAVGAATDINLTIRIIDIVQYLRSYLAKPIDSGIKNISNNNNDPFTYEVSDSKLTTEEIYSKVFSEVAIAISLNKRHNTYYDKKLQKSILLSDEDTRHSISNYSQLEDLIIGLAIDSKETDRLEEILSLVIAKYTICVYLKGRAKVKREDISMTDFTQSISNKLQELQNDLESFDSKSDDEKRAIVKSLVDLQSRLSYTAALKNRVHSRASSDFLLQTFTIISEAGIDLKKWITSAS